MYVKKEIIYEDLGRNERIELMVVTNAVLFHRSGKKAHKKNVKTNVLDFTRTVKIESSCPIEENEGHFIF